MACLCRPTCHPSSRRGACLLLSTRSHGTGRAVDLTRFDRYDDLLRKLEDMFDIEGELRGPTKKWQVVYSDDEDDMMMVGDDPWHEFCSMVRKIFIYTSEEVNRLSPKIKFAANDETKPRNPDTEVKIITEDHHSSDPGC